MTRLQACGAFRGHFSDRRVNLVFFGYRATPASAGRFRVMDGHLIIGVGVIQVSGQATLHFVTAQVLVISLQPEFDHECA